MQATHHYEAMLSNVFRGVAAVGVNNLWLGLFITSPGNSGQDGIEISYSEYARQPISFIAPYAEDNRINTRNATDILFPLPTTDVADVAHLGVFDSNILGSGNCFLYGPLTEPLPVRANVQPHVAAGETRWFILGDHSREWKTRAFNVLRGQTFSGFSPHVALFNGDPQDGGAELFGEAYARVLTGFNAPSVQTGGATMISNPETATFPRPLSEWGFWTHSAIMDSASGGVPMFISQTHPDPLLLRRGYRPRLNPGAIAITID